MVGIYGGDMEEPNLPFEFRDRLAVQRVGREGAIGEANPHAIDKVALSDAIFRFEMEYRLALSEHMGSCTSIPQAFPYYLALSRHIVAIHCSDGVALARFPSEQDGFEFRPLSGLTVSTAAQELSTGMFEFEVPVGEDYFVEFRNSTVALVDEDGHPINPLSPPWQTLVLTSSRDVAPWHRAGARSDALSEIHTFVAAHLMALELPTRPSERTEFGRSSARHLGSVIEGFRQIVDANPRESEIQQYLSQHPSLLALDAARVWPQFRLGKDYIPDFVLELADQQYVLVEIEPSDAQLFTNEKNPKKRKPTSVLAMSQQQIEYWRLWIDDIPDYARQRLPGISEPACWVIIGRRPRDRHDGRALEFKSRRLKDAKIMTYDDLIDKAERQLAVLRRDEER